MTKANWIANYGGSAPMNKLPKFPAWSDGTDRVIPDVVGQVARLAPGSQGGRIGCLAVLGDSIYAVIVVRGGVWGTITVRCYRPDQYEFWRMGRDAEWKSTGVWKRPEWFDHADQIQWEAAAARFAAIATDAAVLRRPNLADLPRYEPKLETDLDDLFGCEGYSVDELR